MTLRLLALTVFVASLAACDSADEVAGPIVSTSYFPLFSGDFVTGTGGAVPGRVQTATYPMAAITDDVSSRGVVLASIDLLGGERGWYAMPLTVPVDTAVVTLGYNYRAGSVAVTIEANRTGSYAGLFEGNTVKVVAVDAGAAGVAEARAAVEAGRPAEAARALGL